MDTQNTIGWFWKGALVTAAIWQVQEGRELVHRDIANIENSDQSKIKKLFNTAFSTCKWMILPALSVGLTLKVLTDR